MGVLVGVAVISVLAGLAVGIFIGPTEKVFKVEIPEITVKKRQSITARKATTRRRVVKED